jgi:hypothetical protein
MIGFIILRHVNSTKTNKYWIECYKRIRLYYPNEKIIIIDDNSNYNFITKENLYNTTVIQSEFPKRGELLPYYYYLKNKLFDTAIILHDSVFINKKFDTNIDKYKIIWEFEHNWDNEKNEIKLINQLTNNNDLLNMHKNKNSWKGCFGGMSIITYEYLNFLNDKYDFSKLLPIIISRDDRKSFERVFSIMLQANHQKTTLLGNIHKYCRWGITFEEYINKKVDQNNILIKVWTGR